jgi:hypothetical protein
VGTVFDVPVSPLEREHFFGTQIGSAGEQVDGQVVRRFGIRFFFVGGLHEHGGAAGMGEADVFARDMEGCGGPGFDAAFVFLGGLFGVELRGKKIRCANRRWF